MVDPSYSSELRSDFNGAWLNVDPTNVSAKNGLFSQNVQFLPGQVGTRLGFSLAFDTLDSISAMFNWISSLGNLLLWYRTSDRSVRMLDIDTAVAASTVIAGDLIGTAMVCSEAGARLFLAFFAATGIGASGARVLTYQGSSFVSDLAFAPPITYVPPAPTEPGPGNVTAGLHYLGYRIEYRSGFITRPSPDSGVGSTPSRDTFTPLSFTAAGNTYLSWSLTTTWPTGAVAVRAIMTPVSDPAAWFYVSDDVEAVVGGVSSTITFTINVADEILVTQPNVNDSLLLLTNSVANVPQFYPSRVMTHGNRMVYIFRLANNVGKLAGALLISNIGKYQEVSPDLSLIQLPGLKDITTTMSLDGTLYIFGPQWTYRTTDNNGDPVTWPTPILVDGRRGTLAIRGAEVAPSGTYGWVASQDGLYFFPGVFPALPISYYQQPDWNRIDWSAAQVVQVKDDPSVKTVSVLATLVAAATIVKTTDEAGTYLLTWDYTNGFEPQTGNYSIDFVQSFSLGAIEVVKNSLPGTVSGVKQTQELWLGSAADDGILRENSANDPDSFLDNTFPIFDLYQTSLFPKEGSPGQVRQHHGAELRLTGNGTMQAIVAELDGAASKELAVIDLSATPGKILHRSFDLISEGVTYTFTQGQNQVQDSNFEGS